MSKTKTQNNIMDFQKASENVKTLQQKPSDDDMLKLYGLYKQATIGDVNTDRPSFWDMVGKAKWDSWKSYEGTDKEEAMKQYVALANDLMMNESD